MRFAARLLISLLLLTISMPVAQIQADSATTVDVETAPDGNGAIVSDQDLASGDSFVVYAISRDDTNAFVANVPAIWSLPTETGGVADGDLIPAGDGMSATFAGDLEGTAVIDAAVDGLTSVDSGTITVTAGSPATIAVNDGNGQSATVGTAVAIPPSVLVTDSHGNPVSGVSVSFAVASGGGSRTGGSATTDASGIATVGTWTLGTTAGANTLTATSGSLGGSPVTFTATGTAAGAATIALIKDTSTLATGSTRAISATVRDAFGNAVPGQSVVFTQSGSGTVTGLTSPVSTTSLGVASDVITGAEAGAVTITATTAGAGHDAVTFTVVENHAPLARNYFSGVLFVDPPIADFPFTVQGSGPTSLPVLHDDTDPDGDPLTIIAVCSNVSPYPCYSSFLLAHGRAAVSSDKLSVTYDPTGSLTGTDTFLYEISDGRGGVAFGAVQVTTIKDTFAPVATAPKIVAVSTTATTVSIMLKWSGTDVGFGVKYYQLQESRNGGTYASVTVPVGATTASRTVTNGSTYTYRVRGVDQVGNVGAWVVSASFVPATVPRPAPPTRRHGTGSFVQIATLASGHPLRVSRRSVTVFAIQP